MTYQFANLAIGKADEILPRITFSSYVNEVVPVSMLLIHVPAVSSYEERRPMSNLRQARPRYEAVM